MSLKDIERFYLRRQKRMDSKGVRLDKGVGFIFGAAKQLGIDTEGMSVKEVFKAVEDARKKNGNGKPVTGRPGDTEAHGLNSPTSGGGRYIGGTEASSAKKIGNYTRKNSFKNGYGNTFASKEDADSSSGKTVRENMNENGEWTEAREELHSKIIDRAFAGKKKAEGKPQTIFMGGGPASGNHMYQRRWAEILVCRIRTVMLRSIPMLLRSICRSIIRIIPAPYMRSLLP